ncbi:MAG: hypothetical protein D6775_02270 [Caldilineae bacterium]|nr:MAG: hypothetical protein D6775_02270 [Caldilineae bacterium]
MLVPLLIYARDHNIEAATATLYLKRLGLPDISLHPGYRLRVYTLGEFQVWRGRHFIPPGGWQRKSSRLLFQLLLSFYDEALERDQIVEYLWPDLPYDKARTNLKVALATLYNVLEPDRKPGGESAYIVREGTFYRLRPEADLWLDAREFLSIAGRLKTAPRPLPDALAAKLAKALDLYKGEFLPDARYENWAAPLREQLVVQFLQAADALSEYYLHKHRPHEAGALCQRILACDNCWERAYRHLMMAYAQLGDAGQVARTFKRCAQALEEELGIAPTAETRELYRRLIEEARASL